MIDINNLINRLKTIDLKDLRNININDLRNIDVSWMKEAFARRPHIFINSLIILVTVVTVITGFKGYAKKSATLKWEITKLQERMDAVEESNRLQKEYKAFVSSFPKSILIEQLISKLSEFAANRRVQITSFAPVKEKGDTYKKVGWVQLNVSSSRYQDVVFFIKDIEDAPYAMRVGKWSGKMQEEILQEEDRKIAKKSVVANLEISSIKLHDD
mgnify:CR=1 FL=1